MAHRFTDAVLAVMLIMILEAAIAGRPIGLRLAAGLTAGIARAATTAATAAATAAAPTTAFTATRFLPGCGALAGIAACSSRFS
jgi:hypothetical protein